MGTIIIFWRWWAQRAGWSINYMISSAFGAGGALEVVEEEEEEVQEEAWARSGG